MPIQLLGEKQTKLKIYGCRSKNSIIKIMASIAQATAKVVAVRRLKLSNMHNVISNPATSSSTSPGPLHESHQKKLLIVMPVYIRVSVVLSKSLCRREREKLDITLDSTVCGECH